ncbi:uncharacterized protein PHACADRAFT_259291 [Phanerochaete carnosa HHB-10118-sp]|uniref:DDE-1 domain-containing protein n=1 Tax=Phanerochaete carnosa (strain HHB-10118-sp) TaxID=650164 RepID=K5VNQ8_PHACS|nr:uncharacterized protein PHACADRAFT_259291 [Phanerochaete carnosa HHB-10118-sp]EKM53118.1 hypothetical protein PHACADRAFT_259291 [Phanerochaete carnosa HHB-10118-sp]
MPVILKSRRCASSRAGHVLPLAIIKTFGSRDISSFALYVDHVLAPYFRAEIERLELPVDQRCIWYLNVYSVHSGRPFRAWMKETHPWIIINYILGGCTGIFQPCDVGIQRPLKHTVRRAAHHYKFQETLSLLQPGVDAVNVQLDRTIGVARDRSIEWMVRAYEAISNVDLVKKVSELYLEMCARSANQLGPQAWEHCQVDDTSGFNLSWESLTSREARQALNELST